MNSLDICPVEPNENTWSKVAFGGNGEASRSSTAEQNAKNAAMLVAVLHPWPPVPTITTSDSAIVGDRDRTGEAEAQGGPSTSMRKKKAVSLKPIP